MVMDYQPALLGFLPDPTAVLDVANVAIRVARTQESCVGYVRVGFTDADYEKFPEESVMGIRVKSSRPNLDSNAVTAAFHIGLEPPGENDIVVRKTRVGAFSTSDLDRQLRDLGVGSVVLAGVHTSGVVLSTVREAHDMDYQVYVLADACADPDPSVHQFLIDQIFPKQARVIGSDEFTEIIGARGK
jgi:nicotinamidase-related amidase